MYSNVVELASLVTTISDRNQDTLSHNQLYQLRICLGDSHFHMKEYKKAETKYKEALQARKYYLRSKGVKCQDSTDTGVMSEVDVKYRLHQCYVNTGQNNQAVNILQSIVAKQRTPRINMALGKLYYQAGMERPAIAAYREVVRECPLALEAVTALLQLGLSVRDIQELTLDALSGCQESGQLDWINSYVSGMSSIVSKEYSNAIKEFRNLDESGPLRGCVNLLVWQGRAHHWAGEADAAISVLTRASNLDAQLLAGMDSLAALLAEQGRLRELETLATRLMKVSDEAPEPWVAMGHFCHLNKKSPRAVYFAHKACLIDTRSVEALLLKGSVLFDLKKLLDAMNHYREALQIAPYRYEAHKGMVDCYLGLNRQREAVHVGTGACKQLNNSPRALTLFATVLLQEPLSVTRAKGFLERAANSGHLPAVYMLAEFQDREGSTDKAVQLLRAQLQHSSTCRLHQMLAGLLAKSGEEEKAMEHYNIALSLDPKNEIALSGLQKMEQNTDRMDATYDLEMEEVGSGSVDRVSPPPQELEDSETEAVWSDGDLNLVANNSG